MTTTNTIASGAASRSSTMLSRLRAFGREEGGAAIVLAALMFPIVIGGMGLGAETGYWYMSQRKLQHAADTAAHAAAVRKMQGDSQEDIETAARTVAERTGLSQDHGMLTLDPDYEYEGYDGSVEVVLTEERNRLFSAVVAGLYSAEPQTTVTLGARAVAAIEANDDPSVACVLALSGSAERAITVTGSSKIALDGCDLAANSTAADALYVTSTASTGCAYAVGKAYTPGLTTECAEVKEYAPVVPDPYSHVDEPDLTGIACEKDANGKNIETVGKPNDPTPPLTPSQTLANGVKVMRFCNGLDAKGTVEFGPGIYVIEKSAFRMTSSNEESILKNVEGSEGVTFYFRDGGYLQLGGTRLDLTAPASGPYEGLLFFGSRHLPKVTHQVGGNTRSRMTGAIYTPESAITIAGNAATGGDGCTQVIGKTVTFTGNATLESSCDNAGTSDIKTNQTVAIVE